MQNGELWFDLEINPAMIPRTTTRREWQALRRWLRECRRRMIEQCDRDEMQLRHFNLMIYGNTHPEIMKDVSRVMGVPRGLLGKDRP